MLVSNKIPNGLGKPTHRQTVPKAATGTTNGNSHEYSNMMVSSKVAQVPEELNHQTVLTGTVNGKAFRIEGGGGGRPYDGILNSKLRATTGPLHLPMHLLDIIMTTGYPIYCKYHKEAIDPFKISNGFEYERHIKYENGGYMKTLQKITRQPDLHLSGDFRILECSVDAPELDGIEPLVETFIPAGPGKMIGHCTLAWRKKGGGLFTATCESEYRLNHQEVLPHLQFRVINFSTNHTQEVFDMEENVQEFRHLPV